MRKCTLKFKCNFFSLHYNEYEIKFENRMIEAGYLIEKFLKFGSMTQEDWILFLGLNLSKVEFHMIGIEGYDFKYYFIINDKKYPIEQSMQDINVRYYDNLLNSVKFALENNSYKTLKCYIKLMYNGNVNIFDTFIGHFIQKHFDFTNKFGLNKWTALDIMYNKFP